jgi:hypothetical protein
VIEDKDLERVGEGRAYLNGYINEKIFDFLIKEHLLINKHLNYKQKPEQLPV